MLAGEMLHGGRNGAMPITEETRDEIRAVLSPDFRLQPVYETFVVKWLAFNRAYNEIAPASTKEYERVLAVGDALDGRWDEFSDLASGLTSLECIGSERNDGQGLWVPNRWVKSATMYLRAHSTVEVGENVCTGCRKREECRDVVCEEWVRSPMAALMRLVYQVRCNLIHGDKRLVGHGFQTDRDEDLVSISTVILRRVLQRILDWP